MDAPTPAQAAPPSPALVSLAELGPECLWWEGLSSDKLPAATPLEVHCLLPDATAFPGPGSHVSLWARQGRGSRWRPTAAQDSAGRPLVPDPFLSLSHLSLWAVNDQPFAFCASFLLEVTLMHTPGSGSDTGQRCGRARVGDLSVPAPDRWPSVPTRQDLHFGLMSASEADASRAHGRGRPGVAGAGCPVQRLENPPQ